MGILGDLIRGKFQADQAQHKVTIADSQAKMKSLENLSKLTDMLSQYQQQQSWADKGAYQLSPGSENPETINPEIRPVAQPAGQNLLTQFMLTYPEHVGTIMATTLNPERQIKSAVLPLVQDAMKGVAQPAGEPTQTVPGQENTGGTGNMGPLAQKIFDNPLLGAALKAGGLDVVPSIQAGAANKRAIIQEKEYQRKIADGQREEYTDPTGAVYERYVDPTNKRTPLIGPSTDPQGWRQKSATQLQPADVLVNGKKVRIWVQPKPTGGVDLGPEELRTVTEQLPGGAERTRTLPKSEPFDIMTKQPGGAVAIPTDELSLWVSPADLTTAQQGMTPEQAKGAGMQRISTSAKASIDSLKAANVVVTEIKDLMEKVFPQKESFASPQRLLRPISAALQTDPNASRLFSLVNGTLAPIVRSLGEKGNLSDVDIKRAIEMSIKGTDSAAVAWQKINGMLELLGKIQRATFSGSGKAAVPKAKTAADLLNKWGVE